MLDAVTLGFADYRGNRQYLTLGNTAATAPFRGRLAELELENSRLRAALTSRDDPEIAP